MNAAPPPTPLRTGLLARLCARMGGLCELLRLAHRSRVPF
jgi:hypothetical protein